MGSRSTFSDMLLSWSSLLLQPFRALFDCLLFSELSRLDQGEGDTVPSMVSNHIQSYRYDVFISFRGPDTRNTFVDHLYANLIRKGIFTFKDDKRLEKGESLSPQLIQAIQNSRVSIVVFSEKYAESKWCLEEMATIAECQNEYKQVVFPIFYNVDPSDVRNQSGVYQEAFVSHKKKFKHDPNKVRRWMKAMAGLGKLVGWDVRNKLESREIESIVQEVTKTLGHKFSGLADDLVGIQPRVEALESLLNLSSAQIRVIGIWGMGGIGKTTLANVLYDRISYQFDACCFIEDVSKIYRDGDAIAVQKQILRQTVDEMNLDKYAPSEISGIVCRRLCNRKVLVVLDNVDLVEQVQELAINPGLLGTGSRMIITTRDVHIVEVYGAHLVDVDYVVHEVPLLNHNDALKLFHRKAFKSDAPTSGFVKLIPEVLKYAQGLPLALRVVGSFLCTRNATQWRDALNRLKKNLDNKILDVLKVSFEGLHSDDKEIFLHISCFFKGEKEDYVKRILDACELNPNTGLQNLIERSLITIRNQEIHMHEMLQELGKEIVRQEFPKEPGLWSRLWLYQDFHDVMMTKTGTDKVKAIIVDHKADISEYPRLRAQGLSTMRGLTILILYHKNFSGSLSLLSNRLQYLLWNGYPFASLPLNFEPFRLVELKMPNSSIRRLWDGRKDLPSLKLIDLSNSKYLVETPNFDGSRRLQRLDLTGCINLLHVHPSIGLLAKLAFFSLEGCSSLISVDFSDTASNLYSLEVLHLSGCSKLEALPDFRMASNLKYLDADQCTSLSMVDQSIGHLTQLIFLSLRDCTNLVSIPQNINSLTSLVTLDLCGCLKLENLPLLGNTLVSAENINLTHDELASSYYLQSLIFLDLGFCSLTTVPDTIGELRHLERLNLEGNSFVSLPSSMGKLSSLAYLNLAHCSKLESLPELQLCATSVSGGRYFKMVSGSHNHRSGLYIFNCPLLAIQRESRDFHKLSLSWMKRLVENPCHFRCGFDIVVPGYTIPEWFHRPILRGGKRVRIADCTNESEGWLGFAFCVAFKEGSNSMYFGSHYRYSWKLPHPLCISFESEQTEETFDIPLQLDRNMVDGSNTDHLWLIYISRQHCHFVTTGAYIRFKAHPYLLIKAWGIRMVFEHDIFSPTELWMNEINQNQTGYPNLDYEHESKDYEDESSSGDEHESSSSSMPAIKLPYNWDVPKEEEKHKIQLRYNWHVTEEEENENREVNAKEYYLSNIGLS